MPPEPPEAHSDVYGLAGKVAWVTGGGGAIGAAIADAFRNAGAQVVISDLDAALPAAQTGQQLTVACDVSSRPQVIDCATEIRERFGRLDILVNSAGIMRRGNFLELDEVVWNQVISINLAGSYWCAQAAIPVMGSGGGGAIINLGSITADLPNPDSIAYAISKGGIRTMTKALATAAAEHGVRVNAIAPGTIETALNRERWERPGAREYVSERTPLARLGVPDDIVGAALFLASPLSAFVTGAVVPVDGGRGLKP